MISNSTEVLTPASSFSTLANTGSVIRYSLHPPHCATGRFLRMTTVCSPTLNGRSVVVARNLLPHTLHFTVRSASCRFSARRRQADFHALRGNGGAPR